MPRTSWSRTDWVALVAITFVAVILAVLPHVGARLATGSWEYLASGDDVVLLAVARPPYYGESGLRDPFAAQRDAVITPYAWMQFAPSSKLAANLGLPPVLIALVWRAVGGLLLGASLFLLFRTIFSTTRAPGEWAACAALVCLTDAATISGRPIMDSILILGHLLRGTTPTIVAEGLGQYRIVNPLMNLPIFILAIRGFVDLERRSIGAALVTGVLVGFLMLTYFFLWTVLVGTLATYMVFCLYLALTKPGDRAWYLREARFTVIVLTMGGLLGSYQIAINSSTLADPAFREALDRTSTGYHVPPGDPVRYQYLWNTWVWASLTAGGVALIVLRRFELTVLWILVLVAYGLRNSAIVTGLEFENFHWLYYSVGTEALVLAIVGLVADRHLGGNALRAAGTGAAALLALAIVWRVWEPNRAPETLWANQTLADLRPLRPALARLSTDTSLAGPIEANIAILSGRSGQLFQNPYSKHKSLISDRDVHVRHALNAWLMGMSAEQYDAVAGDAHFSMTRSQRAEWQSDAVKAKRLKIFHELEARNGGDMLRRYMPLALLRPSADPPPSRGGQWVRLESAQKWAIWELRD